MEPEKTEKKPEQWTIRGILDVLEKADMEVYTVHEVLRTNAYREHENGWAIFIKREKNIEHT